MPPLGRHSPSARKCVLGIVAVVAILVNCLFMQSGLHPAPQFKPVEVEQIAKPALKPAHVATPPKVDAAPTSVTAKPAAPHTPRTPGEITTDVQRELARGYYGGPVDGLYGPRTDGAIQDFERRFVFGNFLDEAD